MEWISVKERMPENLTAVLVWLLDAEVCAIAYTYSGVFHLDTKRTRQKITHWMPLPKPPKS